MVLGLTASAVHVLVKPARVAGGQIGNDKARIGSVRAALDAGDDALELTVAAMQTAARKLAAFRSYRVAIRLKSFKGQNMRSMALRLR